MIPGLLALSALTRFFQTSINTHHALLSATLHHMEAILHLSSKSPLLQKFTSGKTAPGNIAGAIVTGFSTIYSFVGHKKFSFKPAKPKTPTPEKI